MLSVYIEDKDSDEACFDINMKNIDLNVRNVRVMIFLLPPPSPYINRYEKSSIQMFLFS